MDSTCGCRINGAYGSEYRTEWTIGAHWADGNNHRTNRNNGAKWAEWAVGANWTYRNDYRAIWSQWAEWANGTYRNDNGSNWRFGAKWTEWANGTNIIYVDPENDLVAVVRWIDSNASVDGFVQRLLAAVAQP